MTGREEVWGLFRCMRFLGTSPGMMIMIHCFGVLASFCGSSSSLRGRPCLSSKAWGADICCAPVGSSSGRNSLMYFCSACLSIKKTRQSELSLVRDALNWFLQISGLDTLDVCCSFFSCRASYRGLERSAPLSTKQSSWSLCILSSRPDSDTKGSCSFVERLCSPASCWGLSVSSSNVAGHVFWETALFSSRLFTKSSWASRAPSSSSLVLGLPPNWKS